jgi:predicted methyltransferase
VRRGSGHRNRLRDLHRIGRSDNIIPFPHRAPPPQNHRTLNMKSSMTVAATVLLLGFSLAASAADPAAGAGDPIGAAVSDAARPATDTARDADRKPAEMLKFAGLRAGDKVADYAAGSGYFTRLFASVVGPSGHVYAVVPSALLMYPNVVKGTADVQSYAQAHANVSLTVAAALEGVKFPEKLDLFWIAQNYHDLKDSFMGPVDTAVFNKAVFQALKPGGVYIVLDHSAAKDAPADVTDTLHRIDESVVRREVEAAGFKFDSASMVLANPADPRTAKVFDKSIRGHTDQFVLKFRKPKH